MCWPDVRLAAMTVAMRRASPDRSETPEIRTERLVMRGWRDGDLDPFAAMNADPRVMEFMPRCLGRAECEAIIGRIRDHFARHGYGWWAVETLQGGDFVGFVGISVPRFEAHFTPCVEIGWRLAHDHWGQGYATEAARAAIGFGFDRAGLDEIVSFTAVLNERSQAVMRRLGMSRDPAEDFDHPTLSVDHPLCRHVLYRIRPPGGPRRG